MRKLRNLIGMPVICEKQKIGTVIGADLSDDLRQLEGVWMDCGLPGTRYIPSDLLVMIGSVAVMTDAHGQRRRMHSKKLLYRAISTDGRRIGAITGAEIDEISFLVTALELARGLWDDLISGRDRVTDYSVSPDALEVIVIDSTKTDDKEDEFS